MKKSLIYTKTGDTGNTSLVGGQRVSKASPRLEAYGSIDELNSTIGFLRSLLEEESTQSAQLLEIQHNLFRIGSYLATDSTQTPLLPQSILTQEDLQVLENEIDKTDSQLPPLKAFILPGGSRESAVCHICRTVCRRAERQIITLNTEFQVDTTLLAYINRLSDYLFITARKLNQSKKIAEIVWNNTHK